MILDSDSAIEVPDAPTPKAPLIIQKTLNLPEGEAHARPTPRSTTTSSQTPGITSAPSGSTGTPSATDDTNEPDTGGHSNLALWFDLMLVSLAGIAIVCIVLMKGNKRSK